MNIITKINSEYIKDKEKAIAALYKPVRVLVSGSFDEAMANKFREDMSLVMDTPQDVIPIVIDSYGGQVFSLLPMWDVIDACKKSKKIITIASGKAVSCGAALFTAGDLRYVEPGAEVMVHEVSAAAWGKNVEVQADAEHIKKLNARVLNKMSTNIGKSPGYFADKIHDRGHTDWWMEAQEALDVGIATNVGCPNIVLDVQVTCTVQ